MRIRLHTKALIHREAGTAIPEAWAEDMANVWADRPRVLDRANGRVDTNGIIEHADVATDERIGRFVPHKALVRENRPPTEAQI